MTDRINGTLAWDTTFDTTHGLMIHTFAAGIKVITNIYTGKSRIKKGDKIIAEGETIQIGTYERRLILIAKDAEKLKKLKEFRQ